MTFHTLIQKWTELILPHYKPSTQATKKSHVAKYIQPFLEDDETNWDRTAVSMTLRLQEWINLMSQQGVSPSHIRAVFTTFQGMWKKWIAWGVFLNDPFTSLSFPRNHGNVDGGQGRRAFSPDEIRRIIENAPTEEEKLIYWLAAETGLRIGEILGLKWEDYNGYEGENGWIRISRSLFRGRANDPKSVKGSRRISLSIGLNRRLQYEYQGGADRQADGREGKKVRHGYIFGRRDAANFSNRQLKPLLKSLGIEGSFHSFRHANATMMDAANVPLKIRQQRLGHASFDITMDTYTHASNENGGVDKWFESIRPLS